MVTKISEMGKFRVTQDVSDICEVKNLFTGNLWCSKCYSRSFEVEVIQKSRMIISVDEAFSSKEKEAVLVHEVIPEDIFVTKILKCKFCGEMRTTYIR